MARGMTHQAQRWGSHDHGILTGIPSRLWVIPLTFIELGVIKNISSALRRVSRVTTMLKVKSVIIQCQFLQLAIGILSRERLGLE